MVRGAWRATVHLQRLDNTEQPSTQHILTLLEKTDAGDINVCP